MASALIPLGASLLSGIFGKGSSKKAQQQQLAMQQQALQQQQNQFNQTQANLQPFLSGGGAAMGSVLDLLGVNGNDPQAAAIAMLKGSPAFTSQYDTGVDTILQNAAATGGLRGGNTQTGLAQFGSGLLNQVIQNQLQGLGGIASIGSGAANSLGQFGQQNSNAVTNLLTQQGNTQANGTLARGAITNNMINSLASLAPGLGGLFGGGASGGLNPFGAGAGIGRGW